MDNKTISMTIAKQIGNKALMMIGTKNIFEIDNGLMIKHSCRGSKTNVIKITLNGSDLYDMEFIKTHGAKINTIAKEEDIYCDMLCDMIEKHSGLYTHL